jgi:glucokinase
MGRGSRYVACCDIGGTKALLGLVDEQGHIRARDRYLLPTPLEPERLVADLAFHLRALTDRSHIPQEALVGVGCSAAVMADVERGMVFSAPNIFGSYRDIPLNEMLHDATGLPAWLEMDAYAAALGEVWQGVGRDVDYFVYVVLGTGVGAGILMNGQVYRGWQGTAGEFGHTTIVPDGPPCNCGRYGCLEALVSGPAIALRAHSALLQGRETRMRVLAEEGDMTAALVFKAARQGDSVACQIVEETVRFLGIGLANLIHLLNPKVIALGGGVITGGADLLLEPLQRELVKRCGSWVDVAGTRIVLAELGEDASLLGIAQRVWKAIGSE